MGDASDRNPKDLEKASLDDVYESLGTSASGLTSADAKTRIEGSSSRTGTVCPARTASRPWIPPATGCACRSASRFASP